jgi:phospholipid/cholesterol/gamma-HCH transport system substrate-binding protein
MIHFTKEAKIGAAVVITLILAYIGFNFLKGRDVFRRTYDYVVFYPSTNGLVESSSVILNGFKIGQVTEISIDPGNIRNVKVIISIPKEYKIPTGTVANLISSDLMGTKAIELEFSNASTYYNSDDVLPGHIAMGITEQIMPLKNKMDLLLGQADSVFNGVNNALDAKTIADLKQTLQNLKSISGSLANQSKKIDYIFSNVDLFTRKLAESRGTLASAINNLNAVSDSLAKSKLKSAIAEADATLSEAHLFFATVNKGEGSLGKFVKNDTLYYKMQSAAGSLDSLLKDLKANPRRYVHFSVFGGKK